MAEAKSTFGDSYGESTHVRTPTEGTRPARAQPKPETSPSTASADAELAQLEQELEAARRATASSAARGESLEREVALCEEQAQAQEEQLRVLGERLIGIEDAVSRRNERVSSLLGPAAQLRERFEEQGRELAGVREQLARARDRRVDLECDLSRHQEEHLREKRARVERERDLEATRKELAHVVAQVESSTREQAAIEERIAGLQADLAQRDEELCTLRADNEERARASEALHSQVERLESELRDARSSLSQRATELDALRTDLSERRERVAEREAEQAELSDRLKDLDTKVSERSTELEKLKTELASRTQRVATLESELSALRDRPAGAPVANDPLRRIPRIRHNPEPAPVLEAPDSTSSWRKIDGDVSVARPLAASAIQVARPVAVPRGPASPQARVIPAPVIDEAARTADVTDNGDLPEIFSYWRDRQLRWKLSGCGADGLDDLFMQYVQRHHDAKPDRPIDIISIGAEQRGFEVGLVERCLEQGIENVSVHCLDVHGTGQEERRALAEQRGVAAQLRIPDLQLAEWTPSGSAALCIANYSLHHVVNLETLFGKIWRALHPGGVFLTHARIGRNGQMRWPEAIELAARVWEMAPARYKYDHVLEALQPEYQNWDRSPQGEDMRTQDILPLLLKTFHFESFVGFGNVVDLFLDRRFGSNFEVGDEADRKYMDHIAELDDIKIDAGVVKPTHMVAALRTTRVAETQTYRHWSPRYCLRSP